MQMGILGIKGIDILGIERMDILVMGILNRE
jgi:hypothetical protein